MANIAAIVYIKNIIIVIFIFALSRYKITETIIPITANKAHKFPATLFFLNPFLIQGHITNPSFRLFVDSFIVTNGYHDNPHDFPFFDQLIDNPVSKVTQFDLIIPA